MIADRHFLEAEG